MLTKEQEERNQIQMLCIDDLVPKDHLLSTSPPTDHKSSCNNSNNTTPNSGKEFSLPLRILYVYIRSLLTIYVAVFRTAFILNFEVYHLGTSFSTASPGRGMLQHGTILVRFAHSIERKIPGSLIGKGFRGCCWYDF